MRHRQAKRKPVISPVIHHHHANQRQRNEQQVDYQMPEMGQPGNHRFWFRLNRRSREFEADKQARHHQHQDADPAGNVDHINKRTIGSWEPPSELHGAIGHND